MEEWVGSIWHKFIVQKSNTDFHGARVEFNDVKKSVGILFRSLGGEPSKRIEAAAPRDYVIRRHLLDKIAGTKLQTSLAWQDESSLRLPQSIAVFDSKHLNRELYMWLTVLAAHSSVTFTHWAKDNQAIVATILNRYPNLRPRYNDLLGAALEQRVPINKLPKGMQSLEKSVIEALKYPELPMEFPEANYAPQAIYLWLYPSEYINANPFKDTTSSDPEQSSPSESRKLESHQARKKTERVDDSNTKDSLMVFRLENLFSWSEFSKVNRAEDDTEDTDSKRVAEDLNLITVAKGSQQKTAKLKIDLDLPAAIEDDYPLGKGIKQPEWNYKTQQLVPNRCLVQPLLLRQCKPEPLPTNLQANAKKIRNQFEYLSSIKHWLKAQPYGSEIDLSAWIDYYVESKASVAKDSDYYLHFKNENRDISCLLLSDLSMSTDAHINDEKTVIDVIKESMLLFSEALTAVGDPFAIYGFSSVKRQHVRFTILKNFGEQYTDNIRGRILGLHPGYYTRMGAAIRQASDILAQQQHSQKLLLILTDGKPNDIDHYEGRFGIEDTRQAIIAARKQGLIPFCITIDKKADQYLPYIFGNNGFTTIYNPSQLPKKLPLLYHQLTQHH
ncbi:VWA domain-containing protein [Photobacterium sp. ZSDE20]|uniref:VWA domain-containing protein n=1 Tax=Photobacterium pectinilyticum TaxID=2906793 RepID=A0ABT1N1M9_9GAMM|nr:VWA domain-containing protein [Photobacterium sp. ZSDE20]MCQ1058642.1 VWA domain-containing protein [Photobacterium sp. ZSDE20]MDD1823356.1 VWA domain-containing protein [Photobacterium sp. ZSDE20]